MKILVYGAGVIGSIFAGKLIALNNEVTVLARGERLKELKEKGIVLIDFATKEESHYNVNLIDKLLPNMKFDYIIVAMNNSQIKNVLSILSDNYTENIVLMSNTAAGYDEWIKYIGEERLMIGFPGAGGRKKMVR